MSAEKKTYLLIGITIGLSIGIIIYNLAYWFGGGLC
jgi:hypothetical protein